MNVFASIGRTAAALLGRPFTLTLSDGAEVQVSAIWDPARRETEVGDYGAVTAVIEKQLHVSLSSWAPYNRPSDDLDRAQVTVDGQLYELIGPRDDGKSIVKLTAREL
jgi:hypothetical protein